KSSKEKWQLILSTKKLKAWVKTYKYLGEESGYNKGFLARDEGMAEVAKSYLDQKASAPMVIWAHIGHLAFDNLKIKSAEEFLSSGKLLGTLLKEKIGAGYSLIGLMAKKTSVTLPDGSHASFEALPNSLESKAGDGPAVNLLEPNDLKPLGLLTIGNTTNADLPAKQTYLKITMSPLEQFDYAAIVDEAFAMTEVK
ncbi:MAG TPA: erythromycin esterase family protein, partial [Bdellovibrio sp.]|nr:erythromycin esterase family protein [Bdellovibrio sp.]